MLVLPLNHTPFKTDFKSLAKKMVLEVLKDYDCKVFLFGSRATKNNHRFSDMDIAVMPGDNFDDKVLLSLAEKLHHSVIPFKVDLVNFKHVSQSFKDEAMKDVVQWG